MEVKINREIRNYTESMFFGLSMRQFIFSVLACGVAVGLYFIWAWLRSEMLEPKEFKFEDSNYYYAALKDTIEGLQTGRPVKRQPKEPKHFHKRKEAKHD